MRDTLTTALKEDSAVPYIDAIKDVLFPGGHLKPRSLPRTLEDKMNSRNAAKWRLAEVIPDLVASVTGRSNAKIAARTIFSVLQNKRLNKHLIYVILDEVRGFLL
jgi:sorting nexin-25